MAHFNPRDKSRTAEGKTRAMVRKNTQPPGDQGGWMAISRLFLESPAYRSLSVNALKALNRLMLEHIGHGRLKNGELLVTHDQFQEYGVTGEYVADAVDELQLLRPCAGVVRRRDREGHLNGTDVHAAALDVEEEVLRGGRKPAASAEPAAPETEEAREARHAEV